MPEYKIYNDQIGRKTNGNPVALPSGSARVCENFETIRPNVYRKVRGRNIYGTPRAGTYDIKQLLSYDNRLFTHYSDNKIYYDSDGAGTQSLVSGSYTAPTDFRIKELEFNSNMYFTSTDGVYKLDGLGNVSKLAGVSKALGADLRIVNSTNWLPTGETVAYRIVWSYQDANSNWIIGAPSDRLDISNSAGADRAVELNILIIPEATTSYRFSIYRSSSTSSGLPPEDFQLVYENNPTSTEIAQGEITITDVMPDDFKGAFLYTNPTQEGIQQANARPPLASTIDKYREYTFYGNIENLQRLNTNLISVLGFSSASYVYIYDSTFSTKTVTGTANSAGLIKITTSSAHGLSTNDYCFIKGVTGTTEANGSWKITKVDATSFTLQGSTYVNVWVSGGTVHKCLALNGLAHVAATMDNVGGGIASIADNGSGKCRFTTTGAHGLSVNQFVKIYNLTGTPLANGVFRVTASTAVDKFDIDVAFVANGTGSADLYERIAGDKGNNLQFFYYTTGTDSENIDATAKSIIRCINRAENNDFLDAFYVSSVDSAVGKIELVARSLGLEYFYINVNSTATAGNFTPVPPTSGTDYKSTNDLYPHAIMYSKSNQPEAVPLINIEFVGNKNDPILAIVGLKDSLFIIKKKDGVYRLTGNTPSSFVITLFDNTVECLGRNTIARGENSIFMYSNLGFVRISDSGTELIGVDNLFKDLQVSLNTNLDEQASGWFYENDHTYYCSIPSTASSTDNDIVNCYNTQTQGWFQLKTGVYTNDPYIRVGKIVNNTMYTVGISDTPIYKERKNFTDNDFASADITNTIIAIDAVNNILEFSTAMDIPVESFIVQGSYQKVVVSKISALQYEVGNVNNLTADPCTIIPGIESKLEYQQIHCGVPEYSKIFRGVQVFFDSDQTEIKNIEALTYTDADKTQRTVDLTQLPYNWWGKLWGTVWGTKTLVDRWFFNPLKEHQRGSIIWVNLLHRVPQEQCAICGLCVTFEVVSERTILRN